MLFFSFAVHFYFYYLYFVIHGLLSIKYNIVTIVVIIAIFVLCPVYILFIWPYLFINIIFTI